MEAHSQDVLLIFLSSEKVATQENVLVKNKKSTSLITSKLIYFSTFWGWQSSKEIPFGDSWVPTVETSAAPASPTESHTSVGTSAAPAIQIHGKRTNLWTNGCGKGEAAHQIFIVFRGFNPPTQKTPTQPMRHFNVIAGPSANLLHLPWASVWHRTATHKVDPASWMRSDRFARVSWWQGSLTKAGVCWTTLWHSNVASWKIHHWYMILPLTIIGNLHVQGIFPASHVWSSESN